MAAVEHLALALHHVLHRTHLLLAALLAFLALALLGARGAAFLEVAQHLLQLGQLPRRILGAALARGVAHPVRTPIYLALVHHPVARVEGHRLGVFLLQALGHRIQVAADRLAQRLDTALHLGPLLGRRAGLFARCLLDCFTQRVARGGQGPRGPVGTAFLEREGDLPQDRLRLVHGHRATVADQPVPRRTQRQIGAGILLERLWCGGDGIEAAQRRLPRRGVERERAANRDHLPRDRVVEAAFGQGERHALRRAGLPGAVARGQLQLDLQPGPGVGGQVGLGRALRGARIRAGKRDVQPVRLRRGPRLEPEGGVERDHAPIILGPPGDPDCEAACAPRGRFEEAHARCGVGLHADRPGGDVAALSGQAQAAAAVQNRLAGKARAVQRAHRDVGGIEAQHRRLAHAAREGKLQPAARRQGHGTTADSEEDRRGAGIGRRRRPGLQPQGGGQGGGGEARRDGAAQPFDGAVAGDHQPSQYGNAQPSPHRAGIERGEARARPRGAGRGQLRGGAGAVRGPDRAGIRVIRRGAVREGGQRQVAQPAVAFDAAIRGGGIGPAHAAEGAHGRGDESDRKGGEKPQVQRRVQQPRHPGQGGEQEHPEDRERRPQRRPDPFPQQRRLRRAAQPGDPRREGTGCHPAIQSGTRWPCSSAAWDCRSRTTAKRLPSTSTSGARGRAL